MVSIALCMIIYNEEKVILRCLNSILPIIDYYIIVDTGSTDNSKQLIKDFFNEKGIQGEIHDAPNFDMAENLNLAFSKLKGKSDFAFYIDADNQLSIPENFNVPDFKHNLSSYDSGMIEVKNENIIYGKRLFFKLNSNWTWKGIIHEVAICDKNYTTIQTGLNMVIFNDGNSWTCQTVKEKYLRHAGMLLGDIEKNGIDPRSVFYLAQSYKDAGEYEKAIEWYQQRIMINGGFFEERYCAQFMIAQLKWELNYPLWEVADEFLRCGEFDDLRAEHLFNLKLLYQANIRPQSAIKIEKLLSEYYGKNPYPQRVLFINPKVYLPPMLKN